MNRFALAILPALLAPAAASWAQQTPPRDPIVERRMENKAAKQQYKQEVEEARAEYKARRKANAQEAREAGATRGIPRAPANNQQPYLGNSK